MIHIWKLVIIEQWRKKYVFWLAVVLIVIALCIPLIDSLSLWQGIQVNQSFQHLVVELVGVLFLVYFWSTLLYQFIHNKTLQLLWSKRKQPFQFIVGTWLGLYTIFAVFTLIALVASWFMYHDSSVVLSYINLLISGAIILSIVFLLSFVINAYAAMLSTLVLYVLSYSINYIIFSTPVNFESNISFKVLTVVQHLFPRFDILYSTIATPQSWRWALGATLIYFVCVSAIMIRIFLSRFS